MCACVCVCVHARVRIENQQSDKTVTNEYHVTLDCVDTERQMQNVVTESTITFINVAVKLQ